MVDETGTTHTTIVTEKSSGAGWMIAIVLLIAVIAGIYFYSQSQNSTIAKNNAITGAANSVSNTAKKVGNSVDN
jgi:uncharacterized protein (UPF0333 family)